MQLRVILGSAVMLAAMAVAAMVTFRANQEMYFTVDELLAKPVEAAVSDTRPAPRMQIRGEVDYSTVQRPAAGLQMRFELAGRSGTIPVVYEGVVPDTFEMAETVTVAGRMDDQGTFVADQLFVQCPSKYEAVPPGAESVSSG